MTHELSNPNDAVSIESVNLYVESDASPELHYDPESAWPIKLTVGPCILNLHPGAAESIYYLLSHGLQEHMGRETG